MGERKSMLLLSYPPTPAQTGLNAVTHHAKALRKSISHGQGSHRACPDVKCIAFLAILSHSLATSNTSLGRAPSLRALQWLFLIFFCWDLRVTVYIHTYFVGKLLEMTYLCLGASLSCPDPYQMMQESSS